MLSLQIYLLLYALYAQLVYEHLFTGIKQIYDRY